MRLTLKERVEDCHEDAIWTASWTPADTLISGSVDETVKIWAPGDSVESQHTFTGKPTSISNVRFSSWACPTQEKHNFQSLSDLVAESNVKIH